VYDYVAGSLPWTIKWLAILLGHRGSKERGKQELELAAEKAVLVADDARIMLILIHTREKNYEKAIELLSYFQEKYPQNYLVHLDMGGMALLMKEPDRAIKTYEEILRRRDQGERKYAELERASLFNRLGVAFRHKKDLETSAGWFRKALEQEGRSKRSATVARLELGKTLDLMGRREEALKSYEAVLAAEDFAGSRLEAQGLLRQRYRE
jgi:tetratricopeptide (TPR) repeat protein